MHTDVLIIGAGHSGVAVAAELKRMDFSGSITLVNGETGEPYHRPPLSKGWLKGEVDGESGWLQPPNFFEDHSIALLSGVSIESIDPRSRVAVTDSGDVITFTDAVFATGALARPITVPGADRVPLLQLRDATDAARLKSLLTSGTRLAIIGGGFVGLEVAATAVHLGASVCVFERESRVLARLASAPLSQHLAALHRSHGVEILVDIDVASLSISEDKVISIGTVDGVSREFDYVLVAIGAIPNDALARAAGITCANGIVVDAHGLTSEEHLFAVGDVSRRPLLPFAESARLESVHNANEQARVVAAAIAGAEEPSLITPWFWSDQFDAKLQIAGLLPVDAEVEVRGDPTSGSFALLHRTDGRLLCVEAVNSSKEFALGRRQIAIDARSQSD